MTELRFMKSSAGTETAEVTEVIEATVIVLTPKK